MIGRPGSVLSRSAETSVRALSQMDTYINFADLATNTVEGQDFCVQVQNRPGKTVVIAPHGGGIEPGTSEIVKAIARDELSFYVFVGNRKSGNQELHITSTLFDEPRCIDLVTASPFAITVHGEDSRGETVFLGGLDKALRNRLRDSLVAKGFNVCTHENSSLQGCAKENICNRAKSKRGVQMELSIGLRLSFFKSFKTRRGRRSMTERFEQFVAAVRRSIFDQHRSNTD